MKLEGRIVTASKEAKDWDPGWLWLLLRRSFLFVIFFVGQAASEEEPLTQSQEEDEEDEEEDEEEEEDERNERRMELAIMQRSKDMSAENIPTRMQKLNNC